MIYGEDYTSAADRFQKRDFIFLFSRFIIERITNRNIKNEAIKKENDGHTDSETRT
jgi:hypothetical protein